MIQTLFLLAAATPLLVSAESCNYQGFEGQCMETTACAQLNRGYATGLCNGPNSITCCFGPMQCDNGAGAKGACVIDSSCGSGTLFSGKCPGLPADVRCCVGGAAGSGVTPPPVPEGVVNNGWLSSIEGFVVERIDDRARLRNFASHRSPVNKFLLHTIEGGWPNPGDWHGGKATLDRISAWPHFMIALDSAGRMRVGQFVPLQWEGRACRNPGNSVGTIQVEIGGKAADPFTRHSSLWEPVRALFQALQKIYPAMQNRAPFPFYGSNDAYGTGARSRQTESVLRSASGVVGHQHAPSNSHWDPGAIDPNVLLCRNRLCAAEPAARPDPDPEPETGNSDPAPVGPWSNVPISGAESCTAQGVAGYCLDAVLCAGSGRIALPNRPPAVSGCGHIPSASIQCCKGLPTDTQAPSEGDGDDDGGDAEPGSGVALPVGQRGCAVLGNAGTCIDVDRCPSPFKAFPSSSGLTDDGCRSIPSVRVQCCATPPDESQLPSNNEPGCGAYRDLVFPLEDGSLSEISVNWGASRSSGRRCHAGLDIYTGGARRVRAMSDGVVTAVLPNWYRCSGGSIDAVLVYHTTGPLTGKTINYGEVNPGTHGKRAGDAVRKGDSLGVASRCGMLHFELYQGRRTRNSHWYPQRSVGSGCHRTSLSTKPSEILDPRPVLRCTMPANARFRHGISFLTEPSDEQLSLFDQDERDSGEDALDPTLAGESSDGLGTLEIAFIAVGSLLFCVFVALVVYFVVLRRSRYSGPREASSIEVINPLASAPEGYDVAADSVINAARDQPNNDSAAAYTLGEYACDQCNKSYNTVDDLVTHVELRHGSA